MHTYTTLQQDAKRKADKRAMQRLQTLRHKKSVREQQLLYRYAKTFLLLTALTGLLTALYVFA